MSQKVNKGCLTCCCGGEGLTNTQLKGPGLVILQVNTNIIFLFIYTIF
jgi:uncharacterized protein (AIM24 family)